MRDEISFLAPNSKGYEMIAQQKAESSAKKILIAGAFATGKTTLARGLLATLAHKEVSAGIVTETARRCPFLLNREQTPLATAWLIGEQMRVETEATVREPFLVLCDRGIPDFISHTLVLRMRSVTENRLTDDLIGIARSWVRTYELVFWAKLDPDLPIDPAGGVRVAEKEYQVELERSIENTFSVLGLSPIPLPQATHDRLNFVLPYIDELLRSRF